MAETDVGFQTALEQAKKSASEGGIPIGACLVDKEGKVFGKGHNQRVQTGSAVLHMLMDQGETAALENSGRLPASAYKGATIYTTLSPCDMCTGAILLYGFSRVVIGESKTFVGPGEAYLESRGVEVVRFDNAECRGLMQDFIREHPEVCKAEPWDPDRNEDIGET